MKSNIVDYRKLRLDNINSDEFKHVKLLLFWPIFGLLFMFVELGIVPRDYYVVHSAMDSLIPFCEYFLIPYMFWFVFLVGSNVYTFFFDVDTFVKLMKFIIITYSITIFIYFIFPTAQNLRPTVFERDNSFVRFVQHFYEFDSNTNVCPSLHVIGSFASMFGFWHSKHFRSTGWRITGVIITLLICMSTVFLKQHSFTDIPPAIIICAIVYPFTFGNFKLSKKRRKISANVLD